MRKTWVVAVVLILLSSCLAIAQDQDFSKVQVKATRVSGNVYMLEGAGGNIGASIGDDGIVLVDDQFAPLAEKIRAALKAITDKPVRFVINTHYHGDHVGGNSIFQQGAPVIAHDNVRKRMEEGGAAGNLGSMKFEFKPSPKEALPVITFDHQITVHMNGEDIRVLHIPPAHTDGDSIVFFPKSNVVHMGDNFVTYGFPFIDLAAGGSVEGMITGLEDVISTLPADVKVIPGHGQISSLDDVRRFIAMLKGARAVVKKGINQGKTLDQLKQEKVLAPWKNVSDFVSSDAFIETLYNDLTAKKAGN